MLNNFGTDFSQIRTIPDVKETALEPVKKPDVNLEEKDAKPARPVLNEELKIKSIFQTLKLYRFSFPISFFQLNSLFLDPKFKVEIELMWKLENSKDFSVCMMHLAQLLLFLLI